MAIPEEVLEKCWFVYIHEFTRGELVSVGDAGEIRRWSPNLEKPYKQQ